MKPAMLHKVNMFAGLGQRLRQFFRTATNLVPIDTYNY